MICISVTPVSRKLAKVDILNASRQADMVEVCLDHLAKEPDVGDLISGFEKPILVSCRRPEDGGQWKGTEQERQALLRQAIGAGPDYVELELDIAGGIPRFGKTKRVVSHTSLKEPLGRVDSTFYEAARVQADVVKFTCPTPDLDAAWPLLAAVTKKRELPVVGMGLGRAGITFSLLGRKFGSPWLYAALEKGMEAHEGQATIFELNEVYGLGGIDSNTHFVGVIGFGPSETAATRLLNAAFGQLGRNMRCLPLEVGQPEKLLKRLDTLSINAVVISAALAGRAPELVPHAEEAAKESGYADLLLKQKDAGWTAYNTLWRSALKRLEETLGKQDPDERPLDRRNVLVVGTGSTARAIVYGIQRRKGVVSVTSPDDKAARETAGRLQVRHVPFAAVYDTLADVVVIAHAGLAVGHKKTDLNPSYLRPGMTVLDVSRLPEESSFGAEARQRGCRVVEPADVFRDRLAAQFKAMTGEELPRVTVEG